MCVSVVLCCVVLLCCAVLCCAALCCAVLCCAVLYWVVLCYTVLCCTVLCSNFVCGCVSGSELWILWKFWLDFLGIGSVLTDSLAIGSCVIIKSWYVACSQLAQEVTSLLWSICWWCSTDSLQISRKLSITYLHRPLWVFSLSMTCRKLLVTVKISFIGRLTFWFLISQGY